MDYINLLNQEEKTRLCKIITGRAFKDFFKKNEKEFSKIRKGFRAKSLTEQFALTIAIANVDKPFLAMWINTKVDSWIKEIQENVEKQENEGQSYDVALAAAVLDSTFVDNVELYFKLAGKTLDEDTCSRFYKRMDSIKIERAKSAEKDECIKALQEENRQLSEKIKVDEQNVNIIKEKYERKILKIEQDKRALESSLAEAKERIIELQTAPSSTNSDDADYLAQFDDTDSSLLPSVKSNETVSLCGVISDYNGQRWLIRYADLNHNGHYYVFHKKEDIPSHFINRDKIFYRNGPSNDEFYGIWNWSAIPNENDSSKDYVMSQYNTKLDAIEVVVFKEGSSLDDLVNMLKEGIEYQPHSRKTIFSLNVSNGGYIGILCNVKDLNTVNGKITFSAECNVVPVYEFTNRDIICLDNGLSFYSNAFVGLPSQLYHLKGPLDIVKNIVFSSISWAAYKIRGVSRAEYRNFKDFLGEIPVDDIICNIEIACHCSKPAAKKLLDEFLSIAWKYLDGDSLEDEIVLSAISANAELQKKTKELIYKDWEIENKKLIAKAKEKLDSLQMELESASASLSEAQSEFNKIKQKEKHLDDIIVEKEKLAENVEKAVADRIQKARENVADFIANMSFIGGKQEQAAVPIALEVPSESCITHYRTFSAFEDLDTLESHHSWTDVINTATFELGEAGVVDQYRNGLAAFLCAAYIEKQPILLVGPNAIDIIQAFSAAITAYKHGVLCCEGSYDNQKIIDIGANGENIVIINNLLASGWMNRLPEILSQKDIFYVATHPYSEDIQVEPKSLYGFMLPLFTEFFVDKKATGKYFGGYFADDFKPYSAPNGIYRDLKIPSRFMLSSLVKNQINSLVSTMHGIYSATTVDDEFLFAILPVAYASLSIDELKEAIADPQKGITMSANLKRNLQYVLGEF